MMRRPRSFFLPATVLFILHGGYATAKLHWPGSARLWLTVIEPEARSLQAVNATDPDTCYDSGTAAALVNTTLQLETDQQQNATLHQELAAGLTEYLRVPACNIQLDYTSNSTCPAAAGANSTSTCSSGNYVCRGVTQVAQNVYSAVRNGTCTPDTSGTSVTCLGTSLDLTTYLSIQQGQCCLQCPNQPDCTADTLQSSPATAPQAASPPFQCGNFSLGIAVGSNLEGSSVEDLLADAVSSGLLELYLQTTGLQDTNILSVGPTGEHKMPVIASINQSRN